ncbi:MAG: AcrR family transcriptional regulator [Paracoccaceae bacterium]|jgi:AcrR family transcriptional regulator
MDDAFSPPRGSADAWIDAAYGVLVDQGVEAVKVMTLAKALGLSRTSFYWHFKDRGALLAALLDRWRDKNTGTLIRQTEAYADTITEAVFNLFDCWITPDLFDARMDFAVRTWARGDPALTPMLAAADHARIAAIDAMFRRFGYAPDQADTRARTIYLTQVGYISMMVQEPSAPRLARMPAYIEVFTGRAATPAEIARFMARHADLIPQ